MNTTQAESTVEIAVRNAGSNEDEGVAVTVSSDRTRDADAPGETYRKRFDAERRPSMAVVEVVASLADEEPTGLDPLHSAIDPDALDAVARSPDGGVTVSFAYAGFDVTVLGV